MMSLRRHLPALVSIAAISSALAQFAQRGSITGAVSDSTGAVVPDAKVTLIDLDQKTTSTTQTRSSGQYSFTQLNIGHYQVRVEKTGFAPAISTSIELATQQNARFDFTLVPGSTKQTIEVTSSTPLVEADRASVDQNIDFSRSRACRSVEGITHLWSHSRRQFRRLLYRISIRAERTTLERLM
jgi:hypothetical protein